MTKPFKFDFDAKPKPGERIEVDKDGNRLKKYGGTETSWPTHTKVQRFGQPHREQQAELPLPGLPDFLKK